MFLIEFSGCNVQYGSQKQHFAIEPLKYDLSGQKYDMYVKYTPDFEVSMKNNVKN